MYLSLYCQSGDTWNIMKSYVNRYLDNLKANLIIIQPTITPTHQIQALNVSMSPRPQFFMIWYHYFRRCTLLGHTKRVQPQVGDERCLDEWWYSQLVVFLEWEQTCLQKVYPWGVAWFSMLKDGHNLFAWFLFFDQAYRIFCSWNAARCVNICSRKAWKRIFQIPKAEGFFLIKFDDFHRLIVILWDWILFLWMCAIYARFRSLRWILDWCQPRSFGREFCVLDDLSCRQLDVGMDVSSLSSRWRNMPHLFFLGKVFR